MTTVLAHNKKEESILYPACEQLLAGPAAEALLARFRADAPR
jgi:hemerythrin superfamily protein